MRITLTSGRPFRPFLSRRNGPLMTRATYCIVAAAIALTLAAGCTVGQPSPQIAPPGPTPTPPPVSGVPNLIGENQHVEAGGCATISGFADLHNHQFAYLGFGGKAFHGRAFGDLETALPWCTSDHGPGGLDDVLSNVMRTASYGVPILGIFGHRVGGYPEFDGWPRWDSVSHQAVYEDWLYRAVQGGLRLMVMLAVNNERLCKLANKTLSCNDMEAVDRQITAAKDMERYIDAKSGGAGRGWYRIVSTPAEARAVIASGKLAVVLGIEVDYLFNCRKRGDLSADQLREVLDKYYALGVRHLFPVHFGDNGFAGTAFQNSLEWGARAENPDDPFRGISPLNPAATVLTHFYTVQTEEDHVDGYQYRTGRRNVQGLTDLGKTLIREMIARGMIIDVDHMSARSRAGTLDICEESGYPVVSGHTGFVEISNGDKAHEGQLLPAEVERIRKLGGMVAVILHQGDLRQVKAWQGPGQPSIPHTCGNSSNTFAQAYLYAASKMQGGPVGFGTDFNGFAGLPGPRFGGEACRGGVHAGALPFPVQVSYPFAVAATGQPMAKGVVGNKAFDVNFDGVAHVGMLPDLIADLQVMGLAMADLCPLLNSAEGYVRVWERAARLESSPRRSAARRGAFRPPPPPSSW
jgi:microsomal dipeptidase-like Zn-dependent dipeptidase